LLALLPEAALARDWTVQPGQSIQRAVRAAAPGDTVTIERGEYRGPVVIDKRLTLRGRDRPTLSGGDQGDVIRVTASDVTIEGLIVRDSGIDLTAQNAGIYIQPGAHRAVVRDNYLVYNLFGLWIEQANDAVVSGNVITGRRDVQSSQRGNGVQLYNTTGARILDNHVSFTRDGIYVDVSHHAVFRGNRMHDLRYGTHYMNSYYNLWEHNESFHNRGGLALMEVRNQVVRNNIAWGNSDHGIMLRTIQDAVVENNIVAGNGKGFFVYDAEYNSLRGNLIVNNRIGMHVWAGSYRNVVDGNDFIHNQEQVRYVATRDELWGSNRGNYWSNYAGWDRDGNGQGDTPYAATDVVDRLVWRYSSVKIMLNSPAAQTLRMIARQFPLLRAPSIIDNNPRMRPWHDDWNRWLDDDRR
jgi:nitrous oxidase accessory protein